MKQHRVKHSYLNDRQKLFCHYFLEYHNKTKAYQRAYHCSYTNAHHHAWHIVALPQVQKYLKHLEKQLSHSTYMTNVDVLNQWAKIINADIGDYCTFGYKNGHNYLHFKSSSNVDTSLIQSVEDGKQGAKIKLYDKKAALQSLYNTLPHAASRDNQLGMPGSLYYAIMQSTKMDDHQDELKNEVKQLKSKIKEMRANESK